jgi:hypothetical protein
MTFCQKCTCAGLALVFGCVCITTSSFKKFDHPDHKPLKALQGLANIAVGSSATVGMINFNTPDKAPKYVLVEAFFGDRQIPRWMKS